MTNRELHYKYVVSYLLATIIIIIALAYYDVPNLVDKFSFALTLSSLLLAILAIFYTIISANKQDNQFIKLIETHSELKASASEIRNVSKHIDDILSDVPKHFEILGNKIDNFTEKYNSPSNKSIQLNEEENITAEITEFTINSKVLTKMVIRLQYSAMGVLYIFTQAFLKNKNIEFSYFEELDLVSHEYGIGVLNGLVTTGLIDFKIHKNSVIPIKCDNLLCDELLKILNGIIIVTDKESGDRLKNIISNIDKIIA